MNAPMSFAVYYPPVIFQYRIVNVEVKLTKTVLYIMM